ncbi:hypothetical protein BD410DRAFT_82770 [Rickenella mellea]|uniref:BTB domain-containing protein n=1 Tax=Rickenella mellea TaxID=50990 RepID=A0A4Y7PK99_9AGAM|nr:hypothetical protein BD410DRAFT_82770 [Rickenella mellea]
MSELTNEPEFCPPYSWPDADLVLQSQDGRKFRVHSDMMKTASGFFRGMLGIPRDPSENPQEPLPVDETSNVVAGLLNMVYHISAPTLTDSFDLFGRVFSAAEKYEMTSVIETLSLIVFTQLQAGHLDPLSAYAFACRYGWEDVAKSVSSQLLDIKFLSLNESPGAS